MPKTERLYYTNSHLREFQAGVVERIPVDDRLGIILDKTCFYPTSGGEPCDLGTLGDVPVIDVFEAGEAIVHVVSAPISEGIVRGKIDWPRRRDHMEQHSGQHILSQVFLRLLGAETLSFHIGAQNSTIDIARKALTLEEAAKVEELANEIVRENRPILIHFRQADQLDDLDLRSPPKRGGTIRIMEVEDFDLSPCGGTHCRATGEIGLIKVRRWERRKGACRVDFLCGGRALIDYRRKSQLVNGLMGTFSVGEGELGEAVDRVLAENRENRRALRRARDRLLDYEAGELFEGAEKVGKIHIVRKVFQGREVEELNHLAGKLRDFPNCLALLGLRGARGYLAFSHSPELPHDMNELLRRVCRTVGGGGGGQPDLARGGGLDASKVEEAVSLAMAHLRETPKAETKKPQV